MRYTLKEILDIAEKGGFAVPAFNVYNLETLMGVTSAAVEAFALEKISLLGAAR